MLKQGDATRIRNPRNVYFYQERSRDDVLGGPTVGAAHAGQRVRVEVVSERRALVCALEGKVAFALAWVDKAQLDRVDEKAEPVAAKPRAKRVAKRSAPKESRRARRLLSEGDIDGAFDAAMDAAVAEDDAAAAARIVELLDASVEVFYGDRVSYEDFGVEQRRIWDLAAKLPKSAREIVFATLNRRHVASRKAAAK